MVNPLMNLNEPNIFCTYFDIDYLIRGLALHESLSKNCDNFTLYVLALDERVKLFFAKNHFANIIVVEIKDLENFEPRLVNLKIERKQIDFIFTLTPILIKYTAHVSMNSTSYIHYVDADIYFYADFENYVKLLNNSDVAIVPHNYNILISKFYRKYGNFNVGVVSFKKTETSLKTLDWWADACIDWCHDFPDSGRYADQGYLDNFPSIQGNLKIIDNKGVNLAPWNIGFITPFKKEGVIYVQNNVPLIFFHFHGLKLIGLKVVPNHVQYLSAFRGNTKKYIYNSYISKMLEISKKYSLPLSSSLSILNKRNFKNYSVIKRFRFLLTLAYNLVTRSYVRIDKL
jgi:hypothetical protein